MVRPYAPGDFDAIADLDRRATGEDRSAILRAFASPETGLVALRRDGDGGRFVMRARGAAAR